MIPVDSTAKKGKPTPPQTVPKELKKVPKAIYFFKIFFNLELENFKPLLVKRKNIYLQICGSFRFAKKTGVGNPQP
jgi:hypothetical protein